MNNEWEAHQAWIQQLKVGDEVGVYFSVGFEGRYQFSKIIGETTKFFKVLGLRYRKKDGRLAGDPYRSRLVEPTPELKDKVDKTQRKRFLERTIGSRVWEKDSLEMLEAVYAVLKEKDEEDL